MLKFSAVYYELEGRYSSNKGDKFLIEQSKILYPGLYYFFSGRASLDAGVDSVPFIEFILFMWKKRVTS